MKAATPIRCLCMGFEELRARLADGDVATLKIVAGVAHVLAHRLELCTRKLGEIERHSTGPQVDELREFKTKLFSEWSF